MPPEFSLREHLAAYASDDDSGDDAEEPASPASHGPDEGGNAHSPSSDHIGDHSAASDDDVGGGGCLEFDELDDVDFAVHEA